MLTRSNASILVPMTTSHRIPPAPSAPLQAQAAASSTPAQPVRTSSPAPLPQAGGPAPGTPASDAVVLTHDLTKTFGRRTVVEGLNLVVPRAEIMSRTGSMIENPPGYSHLTGAENMRIAAKMQALSDQQISRALALVRLTEHKDRLVRTYSLGMKQRLGIALALARQPELLILDEPTNGLDPAGIEEVRRLLVELSGEGVTVMVSSHLLDEIDRMASTLGILSGGRLVFQGTRAELMERSVPHVLVATPTPQAVLSPQVLAGLVPAQALAAATAAGAPDASASPNPTAVPVTGSATGPTLTPQGVRIPGMSKEAVAELINRLVSAGVELYEVRREAQSLEDVFMDLTGRGGVL